MTGAEWQGFAVPEMHCGGCVKAIEAAVKAREPGALVEAELETRRVRVKGLLAPEAYKDAIEGAGFDATVI
jgi:copper chaperone